MGEQIEAAGAAAAASVAELASANACVNDHCKLTGEYCGEWKGATLRRIPAFGEEKFIDSEINFEWPTQADWTLMTYEHDAKLESLELKMEE